MRGNTRKYFSYAEAWRRIKSAGTAGYHFEVVTLCESIISDRILSYVRGHDPASTAMTRTPFHKLIAAWRRNAGSTLPMYNGRNLADAVDEWRIDRNAVVHGLAKSMPGTPTEPLQSFLEKAQATAETGVSLARAVSRWHKQEFAKTLRSPKGRRIAPLPKR